MGGSEDDGLTVVAGTPTRQQCCERWGEAGGHVGGQRGRDDLVDLDYCPTYYHAMVGDRTFRCKEFHVP